MKSSVALIGFMGTGKTAVGKVLAGRLGKEFIELDAVIEHLAGSRGDLVRMLDLSEAIRAEVQVAGSYRAKRVDIKGPIRPGLAGNVRRMPIHSMEERS